EFAEAEEKRVAAESARVKTITDEEKTTAELNRIRLLLATEKQRHENLLSQREPLASRESELKETIASRRAEIATYENRLASQANESKAAEVGIEEQKKLQEQRKAELTRLTNERAEYMSILQKVEGDLRGVRDSLSELHEKRAAEQVRESQLQMKIDNLAEHVQRRYHVDLRAFAADEAAFEKTLSVQLKKTGGIGSVPSPDSEDLGRHGGRPSNIEEVIAEMTQKLDEMGPVNLEAVQEYDELEERHKFLEQQNTDLTNARRELLDVIARI